MNKDEIWQELKNDKSLVYNEPILDVFLKIIGSSGTDPLLGGEMLNHSIDKSHYLELPIEKRRLISPSNRALFYSDNLDDLKDAVRLGASVHSLNSRLRSEIFKDRFDFIEYLMNNGADDFRLVANYAANKGDIKLLEEMIEKIGNQIDLGKRNMLSHALKRLPKKHAIEIILNESLEDAIKNLLEYLGKKSVVYDYAIKKFNLIKFLIEQKEIKIPKWIIDLAISYNKEVYIQYRASEKEHETITEMYENLIQYLEEEYKKQNE